jgi:hypothetical protein
MDATDSDIVPSSSSVRDARERSERPAQRVPVIHALNVEIA